MRNGHWKSLTNSIVCDSCGKYVYKKLYGKVVIKNPYIHISSSSGHIIWKKSIKIISEFSKEEVSHMCSSECLKDFSEKVFKKLIEKEKEFKINKLKE